jgi:hypothetical protein
LNKDLNTEIIVEDIKGPPKEEKKEVVLVKKPRKKHVYTKKTGRPVKVIDYDLVEKLANIFCTQEEISVIVNVSLSSLQHNEKFLQVFRKGRENAKSSLRRMQFKLALTNPSMAIFLGKNYLGQSDKQDIEYTFVNKEQSEKDILQIFEHQKN